MGLYFGLNQRKLIQTKDLSIIYENKRINFPDIDVNQGNHFLILGRSGSGKTSFLNLIGGLSSPSGGLVKINNENITKKETIRDASCNGTCDGGISLSPSGGVSPYTFSWSTTPSLSGSSILGK